SASRRSWPASATSPISYCRSRARSPTSTPISSGARSACAPTSSSPRTTRDLADGVPMNQPRRNHHPRRRRTPKPSDPPADMWRPVHRPPEPAPITPSDDPTAVIRSLGHPPLPGQGTSAELYIATVVERAAGLAAALAASADLLASRDPEAD